MVVMRGVWAVRHCIDMGETCIGRQYFAVNGVEWWLNGHVDFKA